MGSEVSGQRELEPRIPLRLLTLQRKTQVAIELAERWKKFFPSYSIFWVHATKADVFDEGLQEIADKPFLLDPLVAALFARNS